MEEPRQQSEIDGEATLVVSGEETTLVAPRFDDEESLVARPVVPLDAEEAALPAQAHAAAREYRRPRAPRRSWMLALALVSVLVGGVLGGAGLYIYQRQSQDPAVSPAGATRPPADDAQAQPAPADAEVTNAAPAEAPAPQPDAQATDAPTSEVPPAPKREEAPPAAAPARQPESVPATQRRTAPAEGASGNGRKGARDAEVERRAAPRPDGNVARSGEPEARQVDAIYYRQRRAERRAERRAARRARRDDDVDRLRRIFEGAPE